jgi:uncharacterized protein
MQELLETLKNRREERYTKALKIVDKLKNILIEKYSVNKIVLVGSCVNKEKFHVHSDIDLCVEGIRDDQYFLACGELLVEAGEFEVDLIPIENANERMKEKIAQGKILYEK